MLQNPISFTSIDASHNHSLDTLSVLGQYMDFMLSIDTMCDVGCGTGKDIEWWATRTILDDNDNSIPLDIKCTGIDTAPALTVAQRYPNIIYERRDFENEPVIKEKFDVLWCHDAFQYAINPFKTLSHFYDMLTPGGMLAIIVPQTTNIVYHQQEFNQVDGQYFNYTLVSLIHMLAVSGFDCKTGFFKKNIEDPWLHAVVYKSDISPMDPKTTRWIHLMEKELLPRSADNSIVKCGCVRQRDLVLPWLNKSNTDYSQT